MSQEYINVLLVEDQPYLRQSLSEMIELFDNIQLQHVANNGQEAVDYVMSSPLPDMILMDINMPKLNGVEATRQIIAKYPSIKIVMLTIFEDEQYIYDAIMAGASGYILKDETPEVIEDAILDVLDGGAPMSKMIARKALQLLRTNPKTKNQSLSEDKETAEKLANLTKRETEILNLLAEGNIYKEIATTANISVGTVRKHIENIYKKLRVNNKVEAVNIIKKGKSLLSFFI